MITFSAQTQHKVSNWNKFCLLMWKNWLLIWRNKIASIFELLLPVVFASLLILIRGLTEPVVYEQPFEYAPQPVIVPVWGQ